MPTAASAPPGARPTRRDLRPLGLLLLVALVLLVGTLVRQFPGQAVSSQVVAHDPVAPFESAQDMPEAPAADEPPADPREDPENHLRQAARREAETRFQQAVLMLHAQRYEEAVVALERLLTLAPNNPDALVNLGYAYLGLGELDAAIKHFDQAIDANRAQANAYYGMAMALEAKGDLEGALGGMRSFLHLSPDAKPGQIHVARARSAIWEWESKLGRGPWGPTKGIPPGFTEEELRRDGEGVSIKMPIPGTEDEQGRTQYEIKDQKRFRLFDP